MLICASRGGLIHVKDAAAPPPGAISIDSVSSLAVSTNASHTLGASANYVLVMISWEATAITGVTYAGIAMTSEGAAVTADGTNTRVQAFYLLSADLPASGSGKSVVVSGPTAYYTQVWSFIGAAQAAPSRRDTDTVNTGTSIAPALTSVATGSWVVSTCNANFTVIPSLAGATNVRGSSNSAAGGHSCRFGDSPGAGATITHTYTLGSGTQRMAGLMVELEAA